MNELNEKLLKFAGFTNRQAKTYMGVLLETPVLQWDSPDGHKNVVPPNFPESLDALFKWIVPKLCDRLADTDISTIDEAYQRLFNLWLEKMSCHEPPLALCLTIEKLMDKEAHDEHAKKDELHWRLACNS